MITTERFVHILLIEIVGRARDSVDDLAQTLAILREIVVACEAYQRAMAAGQVEIVPLAGGFVLIFAAEPTAPVECGLELWETIRELPSMSVVMGVHSGMVTFLAGGSGGIDGEGVETARNLVAGGQAGEIHLSPSYNSLLGKGREIHVKAPSPGRQKLVIIGGGGEGDYGSTAEQVRSVLSAAFTQEGHDIASQGGSGSAWAKGIEASIRAADTVVAILSNLSEETEFLQFQLEIAVDERRKRGKPQIVPVWVREEPTASGLLGALNRSLYHAVWRSPDDSERVASEILAILGGGQTEWDPERLDSAGGAISGDSEFYVQRAADAEFERAIRARESIVLVKGSRQIGKTSLIGCGIRLVQDLGWRCATTDFQMLSTRQLESEDHFYRVLATTLRLNLNYAHDPEKDWLDILGPNLNMGRFLRALLSSSELPLVWFIDEADRLFTSPFASDFFGLVRSWHNARATDRKGPWPKLTIVLGYATEAHLFIEDLNQSPFNVGCPIDLTMFTLANTVDLNERYGRPIASRSDVEALFKLVGGQPYLTRRALDVLVRKQMDIATLFATATSEEGPFGDHLKRLHASVSRLPVVWDTLRQSMSTPALSNTEGLQRLLAAGILVKKSARGYGLPNELYRRFLLRYVGE